MRRCLDLALNAWPACRPNPMVGAVILHEGKIISEGFTSAYGGSHAEVNAIQGVDSQILRSCTLYVSLEPCAHHGKTPPCSDLIIEKGIPKVVIACRDPFAEVNGKGIEKLKSAGIEVVEGVLEDRCLQLNKRFITFHQKKRPYVILKWAESADGFIDMKRKGGRAAAISGAMTNQLVHEWRAKEQAILIGGETARMDDPSLTTRLVEGPDPLRFVWTNAGVDAGSKLALSGYDQIDKDSVQEVLAYLFSIGIQSILIEGGKRVLQQFIDANAYDEARRIVSNGILGEGVEAPVLMARPRSKMQSGSDVIEFYSGEL